MSERAIEDWLARVSERGYQTAFCHLLNAMGYTVVHSTTHGAAEEGKDVIALDCKGQPVAFQLKRGPISLSGWRKIKSEIEELVEQPINPAYVRSRQWHQSILVTTGSVHEEASRRISGLNKKWERSCRPLQTWKGTELLAAFLKHTGRFLPVPIDDFHRLLGFMIADGHGLLDKAEFDRLLRSILPIDGSSVPRSKAAIAQAIPAAVVIVEYALVGFDRADNHFARIEAYTMLLCYILAAAEQHDLSERLWRSTCSILEDAVDRYAEFLADEAINLGTFGQGNPFTEPIVAPYRAALVAGALASHGLWCRLGGKSRWFDKKAADVKATIERLIQKSRIPSEAIIPAIFLTSQHLWHSGNIASSDGLFRRLLAESILRKQGNLPVRPLWGPYLQLEEALLRDLGQAVDSHDRETWEYHTHTAWPLILIAARRLWRQDLEQVWHSITSLHFIEVIPDRSWELMLWRVTKGTWAQRMVPQPAKWSELRAEANCAHRLPKWFAGVRHWLPYYLLVYPHRFTPGLVLGLDDALCGSQEVAPGQCKGGSHADT